MADEQDATLERLDAIAASLQEVAEAVRQQREDLQVALEVLVELGARVDQGPGTAVAPASAANGVEVGALMGATQAAWLRLEQRLDSEFGDIHRELRSLSGLTEQTRATALEAAHRPVVTSAQLRKATTSLRESVRALRRRA